MTVLDIHSSQNMTILPAPDAQNKYYLVYLSLKIEFQPLMAIMTKYYFHKYS
jgi:hypothetical protein